MNSARKLTLGLGMAFAVAVLGGCHDTSPAAPSEGTQSAQQLGSANAPQQPFYYYQGEPVYLDIDPRFLVVSADDPDPAAVARSVLAGLGVSVSDGGALPQAPKHRRLRLGGASAAVAHRAAALLRSDGRIEFASVAFRTTQGSHLFLPLNRFDVRFKDGVNSAQVDSVNAALGTRTIRPPRPDSGFFAYRLQYPRGASPLEIVQRLYRSPLTEWADPDAISDARPSEVPTDPYYGQQFHLKNANTVNGVRVDINVEPAWDLTRGNGIRVAVIDDGVDILHGSSGGGSSGDMTGNTFAGAQGYDLLWDPNRNEHAFYPCCNDTHGTSVAGIIAAAHNNTTGGAGVAPDVVINAVRIFRRTYPPESFGRDPAVDNASNLQIADGINWAWRLAGSDVLNNSWGGMAPSSAIMYAIADALTQGRGGLGAVVVFAAGNTSDRRLGIIGDVQFPANLSSGLDVISVGAINRTGGPANYTPDGDAGGPVDLVAPSGHDTDPCVGEVVTTDRYGDPGCNDGPDGDHNYTTTFSGTSAAAPQVSGAAALLLAYNSAYTAAQVKSRIRATADPWGASTTFGAGKLNAYYVMVGRPAPFSVEIDGPSSAQPFEQVQLTAVVSNGVAPFTYAWTKNGSPTCGNESTCSESVGGEGTTTLFSVTVTDAASGSAYREHTVAVYCQTPGCTERPGRLNAIAYARLAATLVRLRLFGRPGTVDPLR